MELPPNPIEAIKWSNGDEWTGTAVVGEYEWSMTGNMANGDYHGSWLDPPPNFRSTNQCGRTATF